MSTLADSLPSDRFVIKDRLGSGGMGAVYRAYDRQRGIDVALKALRRVDGQAIYRFKREFRSLIDIAHPGLVTLHELLTVGDEWFFSMELVEGVSFLEHVRPYHHLADPQSGSQRSNATPEEIGTLTAPTQPSGPPAAPSPKRRLIAIATLEVDRLRGALAQLAAAVQFLHDHGKLHRDIKPSNVLVTAAGRVVLCDFGLIAEAAAESRTREASAVGTPGYMSPEQAANDAVAEASDWYSIGVMLYEALTGDLPHMGSYEELIQLKREVDPTPPLERNPDAPADLAELCVRLLARGPDDRPRGPEVLAAVGAGSHAAAAPAPTPEVPACFVGRGRELAELEQALDDTRSGRSVAVFVHGLSGMGKTALLRHFADQLLHRGDAVVLQGRCYERESVPYKALDTLVDALSSYLVRRSRNEVDAIMPRDIVPLSRLFPVLLRVDAIADPKVRSFAPPDPQESRRRGFAALRYLLRQLSEAQPVVLWIDDLQWGDVDSAPFLADLIHHPSPPPVLLLASYRSEDAATSPLLRALLEPPTTGVTGDLRLLSIESFDREEAGTLVRALAGEQAIADERVEALIDEAGGHPLFLTELARAGAEAATGARLADLLRARAASLPPEANALLTTIAVAGRPIPLVVASRAAGLEDEGSALAALRAERLVRTHSVSGRHEVEMYHDQIRESLIAGLAPEELARCHGAIARALEESNRPDFQALVEHLLGAGDSEGAGRNAIRAARRAQRALAFDRAAHYYGLALELLDLPEEERREMHAWRGDALACAGDLASAAEAYLEAIRGAERAEALDLRRRAVEGLLRSGKLDDGIREAEVLLGEVGMKLPQSSRSVLLSIVRRRLWVALRGLRFKEKPPEQIPAEALQKLEVCWSMSSGLGLVDPMLGTAFQMHHLVSAMRAGDPHHVALALGLESGFRALAGGKAWTRAKKVAGRAMELADGAGDKQALGVAAVASGLGAYLTGNWQEAAERLTQGDQILRDHCVGESWELTVARNFHMATLLYQGNLRELTHLVPILLREALDRGDEFAASGLRSWRSNAAWLVMDRPDEARRQARAATIHLPEGEFHLHHYYELLTNRQIELYEGDGARAWQRLEARWRAFEKSTLVRVQMIRVETQFLRARCALAAAADGGDEAALLHHAEAAARAIEKERMSWGDPHARLIRGTILARRGNVERAAVELGAAADRFESVGMALLARVARLRLAAVLGGDEGLALRAEAEAWMEAEEVVSPAKIAAMYAPGFDALS